MHISPAVVVALALWGGCLSEPPAERAGDGSPGEPDGRQTLPPPGELPVDGPVVAAIAGDFDSDFDTDLVLMDRDGTRLVFLAAAEEFSRARHLTLDFSVVSLARLLIPGDQSASLIAVTREEDEAMLVRVLENDGEGTFTPIISCIPAGAPTLAASAPARIGLGHVAGQQRIGVLTATTTWLSDAFSGEACPGTWPYQSNRNAEPPLLVDAIATAFTFTSGDSALFYDSIENPRTSSPSALQAAEVVAVDQGVTPTLFAAGSQGLLTLDKDGHRVRDERALGTVLAMVAGTFDSDDVEDLLVLTRDADGSRAHGYRSIALTANSMNTEQCEMNQTGRACGITLDEPMTFALSGNFAGGDGGVFVIDPDGQYRCLTMVSGTLELCPP